MNTWRVSRSKTLGHFIGGEFTEGGGETFDNVTPVDNTVLGRVAKGTAEDMDRACEAAHEAFPSWRDMPGAERKKLLHQLADRIVERAEEIALLESIDCGQPIRFMKAAAIRGAANFRFFADKAPEALNGLALQQEHHTNFTMRSPLGPVGVITPWNTPFMLSTWKDRPGARGGLHRRPQTGGAGASERNASGRGRARRRCAGGRVEHGERVRRSRGQAIDRASTHPSRRPRRREPNRGRTSCNKVRRR